MLPHDLPLTFTLHAHDSRHLSHIASPSLTEGPRAGFCTLHTCCRQTLPLLPLQVSHNLTSVMHSDLVVLMRDGAILECGSPKELLEREGSQFSSMALAAGLSSAPLDALRYSCAHLTIRFWAKFSIIWTHALS